MRLMWGYPPVNYPLKLFWNGVIGLTRPLDCIEISRFIRPPLQAGGMEEALILSHKRLRAPRRGSRGFEGLIVPVTPITYRFWGKTL